MRIRNVARLLATLLSDAGLTAGCAGEAFAFETFERRVASDADVNGAARALSNHLPPGTSLEVYDAFFRTLGGSCAEVADAVRFPNTVLCIYAHGHLIRAEWRLVVHLDPAARTSVEQVLSYGLTGP